MCLAFPAGTFSWHILWWGNLGIAFAACSAAALNHAIDRHLDCKMHRTRRRPLVTGQISLGQCLVFAITLAVMAMIVLIYFVNWLTAVLSLLTLIGYAGIYSLYLKHATSQNIVIGGLAGAAPPLLGWVAVTGHVSPAALLLMLIIFIWTPPHFWSLAIHRVEDYAKAEVPMLPNTHGIPYTKLQILIYSILQTFITTLPFIIGMSHVIYIMGVTILNIMFMVKAVRLYFSDRKDLPYALFKFSIIYLMLMFVIMLFDHYFIHLMYVIPY